MATVEVTHAEAKAAAADADEIQLTFVEKAKALRGALQPAYWQALIVVSLLYFARFDASFITLRARTVSASQPSAPCAGGDGTGYVTDSQYRFKATIEGGFGRTRAGRQ